MTFQYILRTCALFALTALCIPTPITAQTPTPTMGDPMQPKREFRGAWIQCVNGQFQGMSRERMQEELTRHLDALKRANANVVIFQVRPEFDALYRSTLEPWSRFLTGTQGADPGWDPLQWMIEQSHARGMELHAWINPYRAKTKGTRALSTTHPYHQRPQDFFQYGDLIVADPGLPQNRDYICRVVQDIISRYDVDGLHIDDYFYPYPEAGLTIPDEGTYASYGSAFADKSAWRRDNVNRFIEQLHHTIRTTKPWVKFGVSPFGIYHNAQNGSHVPGSRTNGLQNYDDLYADILLWVQKGWVDYNVPQIYWEIGHRTADYDVLTKWWDTFAGGRPLVIGQDIERTLKATDPKNPTQSQMVAKMQLQRQMPNVVGSCLWYSAALANNPTYEYGLSNYFQSRPALQPLMPFIDDKAPKAVSKLKTIWTADGPILMWTPPKYKEELQRATAYAVYAFPKGVRTDISQSTHLVAITTDTYYPLPYQQGQHKYTYVVTALDRLHNESKAKKRKVAL